MTLPKASALAVLVLTLAGCGQALTVEQQIIATIRTMEERIENGEPGPFMEFVAADFSGQGGAVSRDQARRLLLIQLNRHERLQAQLFPILVREVSATEATASFRALVTGGPGWIPESGQVYDFETHWRQVDGDWLVHAASWDPVPLDEAL